MKEKTGVNVAVGQCIRFWDEYVFLKRLVDDATYGRLHSAVFKRVSPRPDWGWDNWLHDGNRSGSAALDLHIHDVDFVRYILGQPTDIKSSISKVNGQNEHIYSTFEYDDAVVSIEGGWDFPSAFPFEMAYRVNFEKACVVFSTAQSPSLIVYNNDGTLLQPELKKEFSGNDNESGGNLSSLGGYYNELKYFIECIKDNKPVEVSPLEEGVESFRLTMKEIEGALK
jgi:predicted dehydrogenase